jgi:hypothetical protein
MTETTEDVMRRRRSFLACCMVLSALSSMSRAQADAISGKWGADGRTLLDLTFDGGSGITGTVYFYQDGQQKYSSRVSNGTFSPKDGSLRLEGEFTGPNDAAVQYVIEGQLENEALQVRYEIGGNKGSLTLKKL